MNARDIIDRLASIDEQAPVEEPQVEPDVDPGEAPFEPDIPAPRRRPGRDPFTVPPDFEPGTMPRPKAGMEDPEETEAIEAWLEATEQPIEDWEWDGNELKLRMSDGSTEVYTREQLEDTGVFAGVMSMAESEEDEEIEMGPLGPAAEEVVVDGPSEEMEEFAADAPPDEAAGVLDAILGRAPNAPAEAGEEGMEGIAGGDGIEGESGMEVVQLDGKDAEKVAGAISDLVSAILGASGDEGESAGDSHDDDDDDDDDGGEDDSDKKEKAKDDDDDGDDEKEDKEKEGKDE